MCHRAIPAISRLLYPAGERERKEDLIKCIFLVSLNSYFGLIVGLTPKTSVDGLGGVDMCRFSLRGIAKGEQGQLVNGVVP